MLRYDPATKMIVDSDSQLLQLESPEMCDDLLESHHAEVELASTLK